MTRFKNMNRSGEQLLERSEIIELFNGFGDVQSVYQDKKKWSYVRQVIAKSFAKISAAHLEYHKKSTPSLMLSNTFFFIYFIIDFLHLKERNLRNNNNKQLSVEMMSEKYYFKHLLDFLIITNLNIVQNVKV